MSDDLSPSDRSSLYVSLRDYFDVQFQAHEKAHRALERAVEETDIDKRDFDRRVGALEGFRQRAAPIGVALAIVAAAIGATVGAIVEKIISHT